MGVAGLTRSLATDQISQELPRALSALRTLQPRHIHYKVCSTFDSSPEIGSIGRAIDIGTNVLPGPMVPLIVGAPSLGRYCVFGNLFAQMGIGSQGAVYRLDRHPAMSQHPCTPANESDLRLHLSRQTAQPIALFDILQMALPDERARAELIALVQQKPGIVLFDVLYPEHLQRVGYLIDGFATAEAPLFSVGSSAVEMALAAHWRTELAWQTPTAWPATGRVEPLLAVSGSGSPVTDGQIQWAVEHGFSEVALDTLACVTPSGMEQAVDRAVHGVLRRLPSSRGVIVHTSRGPGDPRMLAARRSRTGEMDRTSANSTTDARTLGTALAHVVLELLTHVAIRRIGVCGGDTAGYVTRSLGIRALEMLCPLVAGAPLCRVVAADAMLEGMEINFKGGQVGGADYFGTLARGTHARSS